MSVQFTRNRVGNLDGFTLAAVLGRVEDVYAINVLGANPAVGTTEEDIWVFGGKETLLTTAQTLYASCDDNVNGQGQVIEMTGLGPGWVLQTGRATLTGTTQAAFTSSTGAAQTWLRVFEAFQISTTPDPVGDVYIAESDTLTGGVPDTATKVHGFIDFTDAPQQTEKGMYTVPAGYTGMVTEIRGTMKNSGGSTRTVEIALEIQKLAEGADVDSPSWSPFRRVAQLSLSNQATSAMDRPLPFPVTFPELTNLHMRAEATSSSDVHAGFGLVLIPNGAVL